MQRYNYFLIYARKIKEKFKNMLLIDLNQENKNFKIIY